MGRATEIDRMGARFRQDTEHHQLTVLHDDGLYRHLRLAKPGSSFYWFELVTWPGSLAIRGDCGAFTFARVEDMFEFFRAANNYKQKINPQYWAEKVQGDTPTASYSERVFRTRIAETLDEVAADWPGLRQAVRDEIFNSDELGHADTAYAVVNEFSFRFGCQTFVFADSWEWRVTDYTWTYLWCCYAIQWGIDAYDRARAAALVGASA